MTIEYSYTDIAALKAEIQLDGTSNYDLKLSTAITAASRQIDGFCGRRFWVDDVVVDRQFYADDYKTIDVDDISTTTGLLVKLDQDDDGTFETSLTITTNFILLPTNAPDMYPVQPYTTIRLVDNGINAFPMSASGRPGVQVTAKFGWPAVPSDIAKACLIQATQLYKASDAVFGGLSFDGGILRVRETLNPIAAALCEPYVKPRIG